MSKEIGFDRNWVDGNGSPFFTTNCRYYGNWFCGEGVLATRMGCEEFGKLYQ